jgi:hypothetical protein
MLGVFLFFGDFEPAVRRNIKAAVPRPEVWPRFGEFHFQKHDSGKRANQAPGDHLQIPGLVVQSNLDGLQTLAGEMAASETGANWAPGNHLQIPVLVVRSQPDGLQMLDGECVVPKPSNRIDDGPLAPTIMAPRNLGVFRFPSRSSIVATPCKTQ